MPLDFLEGGEDGGPRLSHKINTNKNRQTIYLFIVYSVYNICT